MDTDRDLESTALANELLQLYSRATELRRLDVAEHLLKALEELACSCPSCERILNLAYAQILRL